MPESVFNKVGGLRYLRTPFNDSHLCIYQVRYESIVQSANKISYDSVDFMTSNNFHAFHKFADLQSYYFFRKPTVEQYFR